jgi:hypothetical protein
MPSEEITIPYKSWVNAAYESIRLRSIIMTMACTLLSLIPLAIGWGKGAELQKPLAIAVIGGLSLLMSCTLIFVPVVFATLERPKWTRLEPNGGKVYPGQTIRDVPKQSHRRQA